MPFNHRCIKCGRALNEEELVLLKGKCLPCGVRGYKFVLGMLSRDIDDMRKRLGLPTRAEEEQQRNQAVAKPTEKEDKEVEVTLL